jgi:1-acyl-sn-glycerol-3-phosphate acyltransferase
VREIKDTGVRRFRGNIISAWAWIAGLFSFSLLGIVLLITSFFNTGKFFDTMIKVLCRVVLAACHIRVKRAGLVHIQAQKQYVIMMNHVNMFDPFVLYGYYPGRARGVEEESHFSWPLYGWLQKRIGNIPINRKSGIKAIKSLHRAAAIIREKKDFSLIILPEGTRTVTGKLGPFKKGGFLLALESGLDILPVVQIGSFKIKRKKRWLIRPGRIDLVFEKAISTTEYSRDRIQELMEHVRQVFLKYLE